MSLNIDIPVDFCCSKINYSVNDIIHGDDTLKDEAKLLIKICIAGLTDFHNSEQIETIKLSTEEKEIIISNNWLNSLNIELKARSCDIVRQFEKDKRQMTIEASESYYKAYLQFKNIELLIRAITVRNIKILNDDVFLNRIIELVNDEIYPYWLEKLITVLLKSYSREKLNCLVPYLLNKKIKSSDDQAYDNERYYLKILNLLGNLTNYEYHKECALSFEREADQIANNKESNTYYPNLPEIYQDAYNEIFSLKKTEPEIFNRIQQKLKSEKKIFIELLTSYGVKLRYEVPENFKIQINNDILSCNLKTIFELIFKLINDIPFISKEIEDKYIVTNNKSGILNSLFSNNHFLNNDGYTVGIADAEKSKRIEAHKHFRAKQMYAIWSYLDLIRFNRIEVVSNDVYNILLANKNDFIEEDNLFLWSKGITAGLNKDFVTASHILMPQLEHALHNMAEIANGIITSLEKKRQEEPTLGKILPLLKNIIKDEILFELDSFLQSGADINFRNNLLHGLFSPFEIDKYGIYLWWLALKIYFFNDYKIEVKLSN